MTHPPDAARRRPPAATSARAAGAVGNGLEWYDFAVFGGSAALVASVLGSGGTALSTVFALLALALVVRPAGALVGAVWADHSGRRVPLVATVLAMTATTAAIGLLPPRASAGAAVVVVLMLCRVVQGVASGVEVVVSIAYLVEHAPAGRRGLWGGVQMGTMAAGIAAGTAAVCAVTVAVPAPALGSWGWRIPFLLALPLGLAALLLRRRTMDTPEFSALLAQQVGRRPGEQFSALGPHRATVTQGFLLAAALMSSFNLWFVFLPAELQQSGTQALSLSLASALLGLLVLAGSAVAWGHLSDRWGRRPVLTAGLALVAVAWLAAYPVAASGSLMSLVLGHVLAGLGLGGLVIQSTICEALPLRVRTAGIAVSVGVASAAVGATAPLVAHELGAVSPLLVPLYAVAWVVGAAACVRPLTRRASELSPREPSSAPARAGKPGPGVDAVVVEQAP